MKLGLVGDGPCGCEMLFEAEKRHSGQGSTFPRFLAVGILGYAPNQVRGVGELTSYEA